MWAEAETNVASWFAKLSLPDLDGRAIHPFAGPPAVSVFVFITPDCPISNRYVPTLRKLTEDYQQRGVRFWMVQVDPTASLASLRAHRDSFELPATVLIDARHVLVTKSGVRTTPEVAVFGMDQKLSYRGRIDNRFAAPGKARPKATRHDLQKALDALLEGKPVAASWPPAVGCPIPRL